MALTSCQTEPSEIGLDLFNGGSLDVALIDTLTVRMSTIRYDSLLTSGLDRLTIGSYRDEDLGRITSIAYIQPGVTQSVELAEEQVTFDYAALSLRYDGYYYNDTLKPATLQVRRVAQKMEYGSGGVLYNTSRFRLAETPLGKIDFSPRPNRDSLEIILDQEFGLDLFQKVLDDDAVIKTNDEFHRWLPGLAIVPDTTLSSAMLGFTKNVEIRLYYTDRSLTPVDQRYIAFPLQSNIAFTQIVVNRSGTKIQGLTTRRNKLASTNTDGKAYIQSSAGLALRVDIPYLRDLGGVENLYVSRAVLELYPVRRSYRYPFAIPERLSAQLVNRTNSAYADVEANAVLVRDIETDRNTRYEMDITGFVNQQMERQELNDDAIILRPEDPAFRSSADRIYFTQNNSEFKTRVIIYYATVNL